MSGFDLRFSPLLHSEAHALNDEYEQGVSIVIDPTNGLTYKANTDAVKEAATGVVGDTVNLQVVPNSGDGGNESDWVLLNADSLLTPYHFGAKGDGVTNDTAAFVKFYDKCITDGLLGHVKAGTYVVDLGAFEFRSQNYKGKGKHYFCNISTDGLGTVFQIAADIDAPLFLIDNGPDDFVNDGTGLSAWEGGAFGGFKVKSFNAAISVNANQHAMVVRGVTHVKFGKILAERIGGDVLNLPEKLYNGYNPDPYNVAYCDFPHLEGNYNSGRVLNNQNYVGFNLCTVGNVRGIETGQGVIYGLGSGNIFNGMSVGSCKGWAVDDSLTATGGYSNRVSFGIMELDDAEYGIRLRRVDNVKMPQVRFNHRKSFTSANTTGKYWPLTAIDLGDGGENVTVVDITCIHRIQPENTPVKDDLGVLLELQNSTGLSGVKVNQSVINTPGFDLNNDDYYSNGHPDSLAVVRNGMTRVFDTQNKDEKILARADGVTIKNSGFTGVANDIEFATPLSVNAQYDSALGFLVPYTGIFVVNVNLNLSLPVGTLFRCAVMSARQGISERVAASGQTIYSINASKYTYKFEFKIAGVIGQRLWINAAQNSATSAVATENILVPSENILSINPA